MAEGSGATFFMVRKGRLARPGTSNDILESITRATLMEDLCPNVLRMDVVERDIDRTELYTAEEAFLCSSDYEITPVTSIAASRTAAARSAPSPARWRRPT